MKHQEI